jgi:hypothetical protein
LELKSLELEGEDLTREILSCENKLHETFLGPEPHVDNRSKVDAAGLPSHYAQGVTWTREENSLKELEALQKIVPFAPSATSCGMEWKGLQAVRYLKNHLSELSFPFISSGSSASRRGGFGVPQQKFGKNSDAGPVSMLLDNSHPRRLHGLIGCRTPRDETVLHQEMTPASFETAIAASARSR